MDLFDIIQLGVGVESEETIIHSANITYEKNGIFFTKDLGDEFIICSRMRSNYCKRVCLFYANFLLDRCGVF